MSPTLPIVNLMMMMISGLMAMAFYTLMERKLLGYVQSRKGPNKPSMIGMMIPVSDAGKLFSKQEMSSTIMNMSYYMLAPAMMMTLSLLLWPIFPHMYQATFMKFSIMYFMCITSMSIYATFMAGWGSSSKWGMLGALRGIAQTISYEVSLSLMIICFALHQFKMDMLTIFREQYVSTAMLTAPLMLMWLTSILAETHRAPLDFMEGESELVSGFNIEYSSSLFALIFMSEYMNILLMSLVTVSVTMSNSLNMEFLMKTTILSLIFIWARGALPRLRYDSLMNTLWKKFLPFSLLWLMVTMSLTSMHWYWLMK